MAMKKLTPQEILALPMDANDAEASTIGDYLLLAMLWSEKDGFSGKRPFGNIGWDYDFYLPLVRAGAVKGSIVDGCLNFNDLDDEIEASNLIADAIQALRQGPQCPKPPTPPTNPTTSARTTSLHRSPIPVRTKWT